MIIEYDSYSTSVSGIFTQHIYVYVLYECRVDVNILKVSMVKVLPLCRFPQNIRNRPILNIHKKMWEGVQLFIEIDCNPSRGTDSITPDYDATERHCHEVVTYARETRCEHGPIVWIRVGGCCT